MNPETLSESDCEAMHSPSSSSVHVVGQNILYDQQSLHGFEFDLRKEVDYP